MSLAIRLCLVLAALTVLAFAVPARAEDAKARARTLFAQGVTEFDAGQYKAALQSFEGAYLLAPHPAVRVNVANCYERLGRLVEAVFHYEHFLEEGGQSVSKAQRADVETAIARLSQRIGKLVLNVTPPSAALRIDGQVPKTLPSGAVQLPVGRYEVSLSADGYLDETRDVLIAGLEETQLKVELTPVSEPEPAAPMAEPPTVAQEPKAEFTDTPSDFETPATTKAPSRTWLWVAAGATASLAVGWGVTGGLALSAQSDFDRTLKESRDLSLTGSERDQARTEGLDAADRANMLSVVSDVLLVSSLVAGGAAVLVWWKGEKKQERAGMRAGPMVLRRGGGGLVLGGQF